MFRVMALLDLFLLVGFDLDLWGWIRPALHLSVLNRPPSVIVQAALLLLDCRLYAVIYSFLFNTAVYKDDSSRFPACEDVHVPWLKVLILFMDKQRQMYVMSSFARCIDLGHKTLTVKHSVHWFSVPGIQFLWISMAVNVSVRGRSCYSES